MTNNASIKIVIVDDSSVVRSALKKVLGNEGYNIVKEYTNGRELIRELTTLLPDIICLDYHLPDADGLELLKEIHARFPDIAVVFITGDTSPDLEEAATEAGASGFLRKPFTPAEIVNDIRQVALAHQFISLNPLADAVSITEDQAKVVIADDSSCMRKLLAAILKSGNFDVVGEAINGQQAIEQVQSHKPDFVFLDIEMPVLNGLQALRHIREQHPEVKALMVTSRADKHSVIQAVKIGAKGYIVKPYRPDQIITEISALIG